MKYLLNLPLSPSINSYYGHHAKHGYASIYIKKAGKEYRKKVFSYITENNLQLRINVPIQLNIIIHPASDRIWDLDNRLKSLFDALTHANLWQDDEYIHKMTVEKGEKIKNGGILMEISQYIKE